MANEFYIKQLNKRMIKRGHTKKNKDACDLMTDQKMTLNNQSYGAVPVKMRLMKTFFNLFIYKPLYKKKN